MPETDQVQGPPAASRVHQLAACSREHLVARAKYLSGGDTTGAWALLLALASRDTLVALVATLEGEVVSDDLAADERQ